MIIKCEGCAREMEVGEDSIMMVCKCGYTNEAPYLLVNRKMKGGVKKNGKRKR